MRVGLALTGGDMNAHRQQRTRGNGTVEHFTRPSDFFRNNQYIPEAL
jgi:hypothetical protein